MIGIECSLDDFITALRSLNEKLKAHGLTIEIRAKCIRDVLNFCARLVNGNKG